MKALSLVVLVACLSLAGCESISAILKDPGQLETIYSAAAVGEYKVEVKKNEQVLYTEHWSCTNDGKLQCKRK